MKFDELIDTITPEIYQNLKSAVELGKWPDGNRLSPEQVQNSLQAIIAYEQKHLAEEDRTGYIDKGKKEGEQCDSPAISGDMEQVIELQKLKK